MEEGGGGGGKDGVQEEEMDAARWRRVEKEDREVEDVMRGEMEHKEREREEEGREVMGGGVKKRRMRQNIIVNYFLS